MSRSSNKMKISCLINYLTTIKKFKKKREVEDEVQHFKVNIRKNKKR